MNIRYKNSEDYCKGSCTAIIPKSENSLKIRCPACNRRLEARVIFHDIDMGFMEVEGYRIPYHKPKGYKKKKKIIKRKQRSIR